MRRLLLSFLVILATVTRAEDDEQWDEDDYYTLLKVPQDASLAVIKRAYRRMSLEYHPDTAGEGGKDMFQKLSRAYEVLSDQNLRRVYDQEGPDGVAEYEKRKAQGEQPQFQNPFGAFFGFGGGGPREAKRPSISIPLFISLKDIYTGKTLEASVFKHMRCKKCRGTGAKTKKDITPCTKCNGQGVVLGVRHIGGGMYQQYHQTCTVCGGKGKIVKRTCNHCGGKKVVAGMENVSVFVEKGMNDGQEIRFPNMCDEVAGSTDAPGDINFVVSPRPVKGDGFDLKREGKNLHLNLTISLKESLVGFVKEFEHLDGHIVEIDRNNKITGHGHVERIKGEGMPIHEGHGEYGDLVVSFNVKFPAELNDEQREAIKNLQGMA